MSSDMKATHISPSAHPHNGYRAHFLSFSKNSSLSILLPVLGLLPIVRLAR